MGEQSVDKFGDPEQRRKFTKHLLNDIRALDKMLESNMFESGVQRIGAEQELCLVGKDWRPALTAMEVLNTVKDDHYTTEIARFNLEINLDPLVFKGDCFSKMQRDLEKLLAKGKKAAAKHDTKVVLTGILPTIQRKELDFDYMTPNPRYKALNDIIKNQRGEDFDLRITGIEELITRHPNILFEACNTSFQVHLQINPDDFVQQYNWSQAIAGPVLAVSANSPVLLGKRLWSETRIVLFQQSMDTRNSAMMRRDQEPRVSFGRDWLKNSVSELFKDNISRYNLWLASGVEEDSLKVLESGKAPELYALRLHNGTVYRWNRACYGISSNGKPHLRIENRYIPSGPTVIDEMASTAFWLGLMVGVPEAYKDIDQQMSFEDVRFNFYNSARTCLDTHFKWFGKTISARELISDELLPIARIGLRSMKVNDDDIKLLLGIIEKRVGLHLNGSRWLSKNFAELMVDSTANEASKNITKKLYENEASGKPVHEWDNIDPARRDEHKEFSEVHQIMTTDLFTVNEDDLLELVMNIMDWRNIRHVPVENSQHELVGLITSSNLINHFKNGTVADGTSVKEIMQTNLITVDPHCKTSEAVRILAKERIGCLPVVVENKLVGVVTERDIVQVAKMTWKLD